MQDSGTESGDGPDGGRDRASLPNEVREHLGRKLRATLTETGDKPAYLGDDGLPPQFTGYIRRLRDQERGAEKGVEAVRQALGLDDSDPAA